MVVRGTYDFDIKFSTEKRIKIFLLKFKPKQKLGLTEII